MSEFEIFKRYIIGRFNNLSQIENNLQSGKITHPISRCSYNLCNNIIKNLPKDFNGTFILKKISYNSYGNNITKSNLNYLLLLEKTKDKKIKMSFCEIPKLIIGKIHKNNISIDFNNIKLSKKLNPIIFTYNKNSEFYGKSFGSLSNDVTLSIEKIICKNKINLKQTIKKGDKVLVCNDLSIIYNKEIEY